MILQLILCLLHALFVGLGKKINYFFLLIDVFFDADSKSEIRIFRTALVFELLEEKERKNRYNN